MKDHESWPGGECPNCGKTYNYTFKREGDVGIRTCGDCGHYEEYKMPPIQYEGGEHLQWPRYDPVQYVASKIKGKSDDNVEYGDYIENW